MDFQLTYHVVESCHEEHQIEKPLPIHLQSQFNLCNCTPHCTLLIPEIQPLRVRISLRQAHSENDKQHRWASAKPEEWPPPMFRAIIKCLPENSGKQIPK